MSGNNEDFCKKSFSKYLKDRMCAIDMNWEKVRQGEDPPDFYLTLGKVKFAVEVTQTEIRREPTLGKGKVLDKTYREAHKNFVKEVEREAQRSKILKGTYVVHFQKPVIGTNFQRTTKCLLQDLLNYIENTKDLKDTSKKNISYQGSRVCWVRKVNNQSDKVLPFFTWFEWPDSPENISSVCEILQYAVTTKKQKLEVRNILEPKILLLYNVYPFAEQKTYKHCIGNIHSLDFFHSVFVVQFDRSGFFLHTCDKKWFNFL